MCSAMKSIRTSLAENLVIKCYFPQEECSTLTCPTLKLTISILPCVQLPAVRIIYWDVLNQTFDHTEVVYDSSLYVILDQLCPNSIGLQVLLIFL